MDAVGAGLYLLVPVIESGIPAARRATASFPDARTNDEERSAEIFGSRNRPPRRNKKCVQSPNLGRGGIVEYASGANESRGTQVWIGR